MFDINKLYFLKKNLIVLLTVFPLQQEPCCHRATAHPNLQCLPLPPAPGFCPDLHQFLHITSNAKPQKKPQKFTGDPVVVGIYLWALPDPPRMQPPVWTRV